MRYVCWVVGVLSRWIAERARGGPRWGLLGACCGVEAVLCVLAVLWG